MDIETNVLALVRYCYEVSLVYATSSFEIQDSLFAVLDVAEYYLLL